ncbi:DUF2163 domain-containing protein [Rouxiella sp. T17]|uniref:DUF2163 domain-containing protein n=1 Tax=Rouxiella sp. T17 TaxID=3085684 RepID=UPI002FC9885A
MIDSSVLTNADLIKYWNITRGGNKTVLTESEIFQMGIVVKCIDIYPTNSQTTNLFLTDAYVDLVINGATYTSVPDFLDTSFSSMTQQNQISNNTTSFKVSNVNQSYLSLALKGLLNNSKVNLYLAIINPASGVVISFERVFTGYIDTFQTSMNNTSGSIENTTTVNLNSIWKKLDQTQNVLSSNSVHQSMHNGDLFFNRIGAVQATQEWKS